MAEAGLRIRLMAATGSALLCAFWAGCIAVPLRVPTKTISVSGATGKAIHLEFLKAGTTTREEVGQNLGWIDTGVNDDRLFVGRWAQSSWGVAWAAGGGYSATGGWSRSWKTHNLIVDFDENDLVQRMWLVPDKDVINTLSEWVVANPSPPLDLSAPIETPIEYIRSGRHFLGTLVLNHDDLRFVEDRDKGSKVAYDFKTSPENIRHLSLGNWLAADVGHPENVVVTIHFRRKTAVGSKLAARMDMPTMLILIKYIQQTQSDSSIK
jgi:hypothetical protein